MYTHPCYPQVHTHSAVDVVVVGVVVGVVIVHVDLNLHTFIGAFFLLLLLLLNDGRSGGGLFRDLSSDSSIESVFRGVVCTTFE